jgi:phosphatidylglycerol---prolipoprotein diacylglyceryl transferase
MLIQENLAQIRKSEARIENVLDNKHILAFDGLVEILDELHRAGGALAFAVAGNRHKIECRIHLHRPSQIGEKKSRALEDANHDELFAIQIAGNLRADFGDPIGNLLMRIKDFEALIGGGRHGISITQIHCCVRSCRCENYASGLMALRVRVSSDNSRASILKRAMLPYIHIPFWPHEIPTFGLMLWLAAVTAAFVLDRGFRRAKINADAAGMVAIAVVAGIVGAKIWHVLDTPLEFQEQGWKVLWDTAGFAWFGGLVFGISALVFQGWRAGLGGLRTLDLAAPAAAVGYGIGRIGCFLSGDGCYGIATSLPWGMAFPNGIEPTPPGIRVQPTPLYEFAANVLIGLYLWIRGNKRRPTGWIVGEYLVLSGLARFMVEFIRRNPKVLWGLSNAQLASAGTVVAGVVLLAWAARHPVLTPKKARAVVEKAA